MNNEDFSWADDLSSKDTVSNQEKNNNIVNFPESQEESNLIVPLGNQARAHSEMYYPYRYHNFLFQMKEELALYKAAERWVIKHPKEHVGIMPQMSMCYFNPKKPFKIGRTQPDLWIKCKGNDLVLEIDGKSHLKKSPAEEEKRLEIFIFNGATIHRIDAPEQNLDSVELRNWADKAFEDSMRFLKSCMDGRNQKW